MLKLATAFKLSTRERKEFFLASLRLNDKDIPGHYLSDQMIFDTLFNTLQQVALPAFMVDSFDDIVAANNIILNLFDFSELMYKSAPDVIGGYNVLRFVFSNQSQFSKIITDSPDAYLRQSIAFFKAISLPVRATKYYQNLLKNFLKTREMVLFNTYYNLDMEIENYFFEDIPFSFHHATFGKLSFFSPPIFPVSTSTGNLYLITYIPTNPETVQACGILAKNCNRGAIRLASWPEKHMPK